MLGLGVKRKREEESMISIFSPGKGWAGGGGRGQNS